MSIITAYISMSLALAILVKLESILWNMRTPESMLSLKLEREFITKKHETNRVYRRYNRLGADLGTQWVRSKPRKAMLELAEFVGDRALMPVDMHREVYGI
jgi:hypothetical protein